MSRVFLSGGSGFVGGALLDALISRSDDVVALARSSAAHDAVRVRGARPAPGDVLDAEAMAAAMEGCDLAFHVAGVNSHCPADPDTLMRVNVEGPALAVRAAARAGVPRVVVTSSSTTLGEKRGTVATEECEHRGSYLSAYDRSKHEGEAAAFAAGEVTGVEVVCVNPSSVQGPGRATGTGAIPIAYLNGRLRAFVDTHVSIVDIADCVEGHLLAARHGRAGRRYVLNGATITSPEALAIVSGLSGVQERVRMVPGWLARGLAAASEPPFRLRGRPSPLCRARVRTILHGHRYDASRSVDELGLRYTPVDDTFRRLIEWAVDRGLVERSLPGL